MLAQLQLKNFKAWEDTGSVRYAPLTVFFGPNSSGKSSLNQFLYMLKQTVRSPDRNSVFDTGDPSKPVNLGTFRDLLFKHDLERKLSFRCEWRLDNALMVRDPNSGTRRTGDSLAFSSIVRQPGGAKAARVDALRYRLMRKGESLIEVTMERDSARSSRFRLNATGYDLVRSPGRRWPLPEPVRFYGFPDEAFAYWQNSGFLSDFELSLEQEAQALSYLGPIREPPQRLYTWAGAVPEDVGWRGETTVQALLAAEERQFNWKPRQPRQGFAEVVARWLVEMKLIHSFSVAPIGPERDEYEVRVRAQGGSDEVKLTDVGFGVSQVLPVIVAAFYAQPGTTVVMEQPEIHLHPSVQASLADLFIEAMHAREGGQPRGVQFVIESHSEHFLRRLQRRIAEEKLREDEVALYVCRPTQDGSIMEPLELDQYGDIQNWPPDFFGDELEDLAAQARERLRRTNVAA